MESIAENRSIGWRFENTYARLPDAFFAPAAPARMPAPTLVLLNHGLAMELGLDFHGISPKAAAELFAGQVLPEGARPIAQAYAGHQFGSFTMLGDGRAILIGEHRTPGGKLVDIQLKGAGQTRFSRNGDGRAALGPMLREFIFSEAKAGLGIPTTRSLAVVTTGEQVYRTTQLQGSILTRIADSHLRVGTFEYAAARRNLEHLRSLADYAITRHYPELTDVPHKYLEFLRAVMKRQASLIARWQLVGFIHGVMNTDNMAISGETIDYGPCAFMNSYRADTVFSSIDYAGRYAYGNQPRIGQWNLSRFAETLLPLIHADEESSIAMASEAINGYPAEFDAHWLAGMRTKLGLETDEPGDPELIRDLLEWMESSQADFTNTFRRLSSGEAGSKTISDDPVFLDWHARWQRRLGLEADADSTPYDRMRSVNPAVIARNHRVEGALSAAEQGDLAAVHRLLAVLAAPYAETPDSRAYQEPPADDRHYRTFCGT